MLSATPRCSTLINMGLFDDQRLTRLTISVTRTRRRKLGEFTRRGVTMARVPRAALDECLDTVTRAMDQEQMAAAKVSPGAVQAPR